MGCTDLSISGHWQKNLLFGVDTDLLNLLKAPKVDSLVAALTSSSVLSPDREDALKAEE